MHIIHVADATVIVLKGIVDSIAVAEWWDNTEPLLQHGGGKIYLDLSDVIFIDACAIGSITFLFKRLHAQGRTLHLVGLRGQPKRLLGFLRIDRVIETLPGVPVGYPARVHAPLAHEAT